MSSERPPFLPPTVLTPTLDPPVAVAVPAARSPSQTEQEMQVIEDCMREGYFKFALPVTLTFLGCTYLMRRRARQLKSTPIENFILAGFNYYGALSLGFIFGLALYGPMFESKILDRIPDSNIAKDIRASRANR